MIERVVSGGQTGVDRGALEAALAAGAGCGGWCPRGRRAEDGAIPARYPLKETSTSRYIERTRRNVRDSDGTLLLGPGAPEGGTAATLACALRLGRPHLVVDMCATEDEEAAARIVSWVRAEGIRVLNVAGPRASGWAAGEERARAVVGAVLAALADTPRLNSG